MILIVDDDLAVRTSITLELKQAGYLTVMAPGPDQVIKLLCQYPIRLVIMDMNFSNETSGDEGLALLKKVKKANLQIPVILITGWGSIDLAVMGMKYGATDFISKPWDPVHLLKSVQTALSLSYEKKISHSRAQLDNLYDFRNIIGQDKSLLKVLSTVGRVSKTDAFVLIQGESGTGKELIAEAIHQNSSRSDQPFVKVNMGGIPVSLFESEMFGHVKGAFTDAKSDRVGRFELANKGTIFLDEIGALDMGSQVKLLRVLQDRSFEVLGDSRKRTVDVRVICASNQDLCQLVAERKFREDLFYRINLITFSLPALRERSVDIPLLVDFFLNNLRTLYHRPKLEVSKDTMEWLTGIQLPGNIRELKNLVERTVLVSEKDHLRIDDFLKQIQDIPNKQGLETLPPIGSMTLEQIESKMIKKALKLYQNNISHAAKSLGLSRGALYRRLDKYNIPHEAPY